MIRNFAKRLLGAKKGAALVEYGLLIAGVALISAAAVSIFGAKTSDLVASVATVLPGAHTSDNAPIVTGKLIETVPGGTGTNISLDVKEIFDNSGTERLGDNLLGTTNNAATGNALTSLLIQSNTVR